MKNMNLQIYNDNPISFPSDKKIVCVGYSAKHLKCFGEETGRLRDIDLIIDDNPKNQGTRQAENHTVSVVGFDKSDGLKPEETVLLIMDDYFGEQFERVQADPYLSSKFETVWVYLDRESRIYHNYTVKYREDPLRDLIVFRSGPHSSAYVKGTDFSDNARAVFEYMLSTGLNEKYELVWLVKDPEDDRYAPYRQKNVRFISFDLSDNEDEALCEEYYDVLCHAKFIFMTDAYGFCRYTRGDQTRVQLWHGCGFKTRVNFVRCEKRYEYMPVISPVYAKIHKDIYGLRDDQVHITGYPKEDWLFHSMENWKEKLGIGDAKHYIFWLPTFRTPHSQLSGLKMEEHAGETGLSFVLGKSELQKLEDLLAEEDTILLIKLHPFQDRSVVRVDGMEHIHIIENSDLIKEDIEINRLMAYADAMISDYSSAAIDYLMLDRPLGFTIDDIDEYEKGRGFVFDPIRDWLPGAEIDSFDALCTFISEISRGEDSSGEKRKRLRAKLHDFSDDNSCRRLLEDLKIPEKE